MLRALTGNRHGCNGNSGTGAAGGRRAKGAHTQGLPATELAGTIGLTQRQDIPNVGGPQTGWLEANKEERRSASHRTANARAPMVSSSPAQTSIGSTWRERDVRPAQVLGVNPVSLEELSLAAILLVAFGGVLFVGRASRVHGGGDRPPDEEAFTSIVVSVASGFGLVIKGVLLALSCVHEHWSRFLSRRRAAQSPPPED